jgi:glycosyltransferase involved in cell wall biosynthesis
MKYVARHYTKTQCNDLDAVIVPSTAMQEVLMHYGVKTFTEVLPTGIELEKFQSGDGEKFRKNYNIPLDRPTLIFIGRVAFEKNIDFLLRVVDKVRQRIPNVLLLIAGEGPSLPHLKKLAEKLHLNNNVIFVGYLDRNKELLDCYASGDAFVFASNTETQGLVLLEAMALGVPLVSTAVMGTKDILAPNKGALVCDESIDEFANGVITLLEDKQLREKLSKEALEYVKSWSAPSMAKKLVSFYEHVIHNVANCHPH